MSESVMRQNMETWLKKECFDIGINFIQLMTCAEDMMDCMHESDVRATMRFKSYFDNKLSSMEKAGYITSGEAMPITNEMKKITDMFAAMFVGDEIYNKEPYTKMFDLVKKLTLLSLEKTVECQCGKPGV